VDYTTSGIALTIDDVGASSKHFEVYGLTRLPLGRLKIPFPGNFLFLKYMPPIKRWGPYRELEASEWDRILSLLETGGSRLTVAITAGWVEANGRIVPFPHKYPEAAAVIREGVARGLLEIANHGYTHCVVTDRAFRPRMVRGNRPFHREFLPDVPESAQRHHLRAAQAILQDFFGVPVVTFVPPGNAFTAVTVALAVEHGLRYLSCRDAARFGPIPGMTYVNGPLVRSLHDRDLVLGGIEMLARELTRQSAGFVTVREVGARQRC
jgi:hypothetical protein